MLAAAMVPATVIYGVAGAPVAGQAPRFFPFLWARKAPPYEHGPDARRVDRQLGRRLREARRLVGASPDELGAAIGVGAATVRRYETGARRMSPARFAAAVIFLGLPMSWYFRDDEPPGR